MHIRLDKGVEFLANGEVIAIPTDTVYGLAADFQQEQAVHRVFEIKGRPTNNPLIILCPSAESILPLLHDSAPDIGALTERFWPGALTLVLPIREEMVPPDIRAGLPTQGFRVPDHPLTRELLESYGPVVAPSANLSGHPSATAPEHVEQDFGADFPVLDGGACAKGIESTILCWEDEGWVIRRQGAVSVEVIEEVLGYPPRLASALRADLPRYHPNAHLNWGLPEDLVGRVILGFDGREYNGANVVSLGDLDDPQGILRNLYDSLRKLDEYALAEVYVDHEFQSEGSLATLKNRLWELCRHPKPEKESD